MSRILHSLVWAFAIIAAAWIATSNSLSDGASTAIVMGLSSAAWAALDTKRGCRQRCAS